MSLLDGLLNQVSGHGLDGLAAKVGLTPDQVQMALQALHHAAPQPGDTAQTAAAATGLPEGPLQQILAHIGGEGALGQLAGALGGGAGGGGLGGMLGGGGAGGGLGEMLGGLLGGER